MLLPSGLKIRAYKATTQLEQSAGAVGRKVRADALCDGDTAGVVTNH